MSLLPYLLEESLLGRPSRILDQHFGLTLDPDDFVQPMTVPRTLVVCPAGYLRNWRSAASQQDSGSTVTFDKDKFQANLDVQQFKPEEISVKVTGENTITIEGKHEEKKDEHGQIYRHFVRTYKIPKNCDMSKVESKLSSDGVLSIMAPRLEEMDVEHKNIPITQTGEPAKEKSKKKNEEDKKLKEK
ncbi:protein lethal(2)essential for life-like [Leptinotarsa decemlineata]|uniref:protein lethal(2)essential for life-like n=1 Tax=Leptinotarsa decemlineata TaxID=7539 RepID=UPI000C254A20|nr:protein lethal(2)essential for life-like [Leptinotarsa decemlineata]